MPTNTFPSSAYNNNYTIDCFDEFINTHKLYTFQDNTVSQIHGINDTPYPEPDVVNFKPIVTDYIT